MTIVKPGMTQVRKELLISVRWSMSYMRVLDAGMKHVDIDFLGAGMPALGSMSTTGGHIVWSGNARTMPGYLITMDPVAVPFTQQVLWVHGAFGDYKMLFKAHPRLDVQLGLDHVALWGGTSPDFGTSANDKDNVIGDQRGGLLFRVDWRGDGWKTAFQRDVPYDDGSGMLGIQNWPDGVYTFWFGSDDKDRWVSDILYEYHYTMKQSGTYHARPNTDEEKQHLDPSDPYHYENHIYGGLDNYFNNGEYRSGWTYYGRTIGNPLISPMGTHDCTWTARTPQPVLGVENNRIKAHHLSLSGKALHKLPYKLMLTYSQNFGTYWTPYLGESQIFQPWGTVPETPLHQVSAAFVGEFPFFSHLTLTYGLFADKGQLLPDVFGATVGVRWSLK